MTDKFTVRDFFAYFLSGCAFYIALLFAEFDKILSTLILYKEFMKDNSTILVFAVLPFLYFTGQTIQSIDTLFYEIGTRIWKAYKIKHNKVLKFLYYFICSHRISGNLNLQSIEPSTFWTKCNDLELVSKYGHAEYWYIMNDLFKGVSLVNIFFMGYSFLHLKLALGFCFLFLAFIFWLRARYYAVIFIDTVLSSRKSLDSIKPESKK